MPHTSKTILLILAFLSAAYFAAFCFPNAGASDDIKMVLAVEPDEAVPLPYVFDMIQPGGTLKETLYNFVFYKYYFYGYPHFAFSAAALIPVQWAGELDNTPLVMVVLRQVVILLPMLAAIWILVYLQTGFRSWKAVPVFMLLLSLPAVVQNNFWWHPDGLAILLMMLALFFLVRDDLRFGRNFYIAAVLCGFSAMTKGIGFYFFLSVGVYLAVGLFHKKLPLRKLIPAAFGFLLVMAAAYFAANPTLVYSGIRRRFFEVMQSQSLLLTQGYGVRYAKGLAAAWPQLRTFYGGWPALLAALAACLWGIWHGPRRLLQGLILAWILPLSVLDFGIIHFKYQYWLPAALPLFSTIAAALPQRLDLQNLRSGIKHPSFGPALFKSLLGMLLVGLIAAFVVQDVGIFNRQIRRAITNPAISFYDEAAAALAPLPPDAYFVYHDVRMYVPEASGWVTESIFDVLTYPYIEQRGFDILLVMQSRIDDYLNPAVEGLDPAQLALGRAFYQDAAQGAVQGYRLAYRTGFGLVFIREALYAEYFPPDAVPESAWPVCTGCPSH